MAIREFDYTNRECGDCSECCQGHLYGDAHGIPFFPGQPCHYWDPSGSCGGCSIHADRPPICSDFECLWKQTKQMPQWMRPDRTKVLMYQRAYQDVEGDYLEPGDTIQWISAVECNQKMDAQMLSWLIQQARSNNWNLHYQINKVDHYLGSETFHDFVNESAAGVSQSLVYNDKGQLVK